jgi:SAM-dependent methyltransferase
MDGNKPQSEIELLKQKLRATWMSGDFGRIATSFEAGAAQFVERLDLKPGMEVLDVACGTGNLAIPAACTGADVTGLDIVPDLIDQARKIADTLGVKASFDIGDAEAMPYDDGSFDVVMSMFGAMFAPRPDVVAGELKRVCKPGGLITMANWTPGGFIGQMFKITGKYVTPPAGMISPLLWGDEETVIERLSDGIAELQLTRRTIDFVFPFAPADVVEHFRQFYGPTLKAFESLDANTRPALRAELEELWANNNSGTDGTTLVSAEYLEVNAVRA